MNISPKNILGGLGFFDETDFEKESSDVAESVKGLYEMVFSKEETKFPKEGSIEFNQKQDQDKEKQKVKAEKVRAFFQSLKEDMERARKAKDKLLFEEEIWDIVTNLPTEQKNQLLHYQASYRDRSIYQRAELRRKILESKKKEEKKQKEASIPSPAKKANALETAFEGGSGKQGGGTSNLSNQAVG